jgi:hypothetical protein
MHSRRQFLKLMGIALVSSRFSFPFTQTKSDEYVYGRALSAVDVYRHRTTNNPLSRLWPDSVTHILDLQDDWYQIPGGYVRREGLQPVLPYTLPTSISMLNQPVWGEVVAPVAPIYTYCTAYTPLITRIGQGGVALITDYLPDPQGGWYAIADDTGTLLGWSQAIYWQMAAAEAFGSGKQYVEVNLTTQRLTAWENERVILDTACSTDPTASPGIYQFQARKPGGIRLTINDSGSTLHGVPWIIQFDQNLALGGAYWHNRFGESQPGMAVQVTPLIARWLYSWLGAYSEIRLV